MSRVQQLKCSYLLYINYLPPETKRVDILKWFSVIPYKSHHDLASEGRVAGTGQWLFQREEFTKWQQSEKSEVLWLHGIRKSYITYVSTIPHAYIACIAGAGKTKLV